MPMPASGDVPGIDADSERGRAFFLIAAVVAVMMSAWHTVNELRYLTTGRTTTATVARVNRVSDPGRGRPKHELRVEVEFSDDQKPRHAVLRRPIDSMVREGQQVELEYLPASPDHVRFRGDRPTFWLLLFAASASWMTWSIIRLARESRSPPSTRRR